MMRSDLDHLPASKRREIDRIVRILFEEFEAALKNGQAEWKRRAEILKVILYGSFARGTWVDNRSAHRHYMSDYDLLIIVNQPGLIDARFWYKAEDRCATPGSGIPRPVHLTVMTLQEFNARLGNGEYFFVDVAREGIALHEVRGHPLAMPRNLSPAEAHATVKGYFNEHRRDSEQWLDGARMYLARQTDDRQWLNKAAFHLHQATETVYAALLLTWTLYRPATHNIRHFRNRAYDLDPRVEEAWLPNSRVAERRFELLKDAYVKARYSPHYEITRRELEWLFVRIERLQALVWTSCEERLNALAEKPLSP